MNSVDTYGSYRVHTARIQAICAIDIFPLIKLSNILTVLPTVLRPTCAVLSDFGATDNLTRENITSAHRGWLFAARIVFKFDWPRFVLNVVDLYVFVSALVF